MARSPRLSPTPPSTPLPKRRSATKYLGNDEVPLLQVCGLRVDEGDIGLDSRNQQQLLAGERTNHLPILGVKR